MDQFYKLFLHKFIYKFMLDILDLFVYLVITVTVILIYVFASKSPDEIVEGYRGDLFTRFHYLPMSDMLGQRGRFKSKFPNIKPGRLKIIMGRPYRKYDDKEGSWHYPWHFPEVTDLKCLDLSNELCDEKLNMRKQFIKPSRCFDEVYSQCRKGIDPLHIKVRLKGIPG